MVLDGSVTIGAHGRMYHRRRTWHGATTDYLSPLLVSLLIRREGLLMRTRIPFIPLARAKESPLAWAQAEAQRSPAR